MFRALLLGIFISVGSSPLFALHTPRCYNPENPPEDFAALRACQVAVRLQLVEDQLESTGQPPSKRTLDLLDNFQREEVRSFFSGNPDGAIPEDESLLDGDGWFHAPEEVQDTPKVRGSKAKQSRTKMSLSSIATEALKSGKSAPALHELAFIAPPEQLDSFQRLKVQLLGAGGKDGGAISAEEARDINSWMKSNRRVISPQMQSLLGTAKKDAGKGNGSVDDLRRAARDADKRGQKFNVPSSVRSWLLGTDTQP